MNPLWIPAKWFTPTTGRQISLLVLHRQEAPAQVGTAEATAHFFQRLPEYRIVNGKRVSTKASVHRVYDPGTKVKCVEDKDVAYAAPGTNHNGLHYELPGYSADNDWSTPPVEAAMYLCAEDVVEDANKYRIPLTFLNHRDLVAGRVQGVTTHWEITQAWHKTDHTDPGNYFPIGRFMEMCSNNHGSHLPPPVAEGRFTGGDEGLAPAAGLNFITSEEAKLPGAGFYTATADGGIRVGGQGFIPPVGAWNYLGLDPKARQGDRHCTGISPNEDGAPGYTLHFSDGTRFKFGPGQNDWPA